MRIMRRPVAGFGITNHPVIAITGGFPGRPCSGYSARMAALPFNMSGPQYKGMDPSDPSTWVRPWNPQQGMIALLNYDGAAVQDRTPTQLQRGQQSRPRKLRMGTWA